MNIGDLFLTIGAKTDMASIRNSVATLTAAFAGVSYGLNKFLNTTISKATDMQNFELQTGLAANRLLELQQVAQSVNLGISAEDVTRSIMGLQKAITDIKLGLGDVTPFRLLGIDPRGGVFNVLDQIRNRIQGLDNATAVNMIQRLGLDPKMLSVLRLSNQEYEKLSKNVFLNTKQRSEVLALGQAVKQLTLYFIGLKDQAVAKISPQLTLLVEKFFKWMKDNSKDIINAISQITNIFAHLGEAVGRSFDLIASGISYITKSSNGIEILAGTVAMLALTFKPVLFALTAIMLLLDDIQVWKLGGQSLFGGLYDALAKIPDIEKHLGFAAAAVALDKLVPMVWKLAAGLWSVGGASNLIRKAGLFVLLEGLSYLYGHKDKITSAISEAFKYEPDEGDDLVWKDELVNANNNLSISDVLSKNSSNVLNNIDNTNNSVTNNITMNIQSQSDNPKDVGNEVLNQMKFNNLRWNR